MNTITDIIFGPFTRLYEALESNWAEMSEAGLNPSVGTMIRISIWLAIWMGSGFAAATIAEIRGRNRFLHFCGGLAAPYIYPTVLLFILPKTKILDEEEEDDQGNHAEENELPGSALKSVFRKERSGNPIEDPDEAEAEPEQALDQRYFASIATDEAGNRTGPFILNFDDGRTLEIRHIIDAMPELLVVEIVQNDGKPGKIRCPYSKITACKTKERWVDEFGEEALTGRFKAPMDNAGNDAPTEAAPAPSPEDPDGTIKMTASAPHAKMPPDREHYVILDPGSVIGNCRIVREIGKGGMAVVYRAHHNVLDIPVALKVLSCKVDRSDPEYSERFMREAKFAAKIKHDNVVNVMDAGRDKNRNCYYIALEYISAGSVLDIIREEGSIDEENSVKIAISVANALEVAAGHMIVHRDVKPGNMMLTEDGIIKLSDLGIAKQAQKTDDQHLTLNDTIMGSPSYMSPEQAKDFRNVDSRTDIYSLGASLYHMVTGQPPFMGDTHINTLMKVLSDPTPDPRLIKPEISDGMAELIMKMMAKNTNDRFQTPGEALVAMHRLLGEDIYE